MRGIVVIDVHHCESVDVVALALRLGASRLGLLNGRQTERKIRRWHWTVGIAEERKSNAPIGDGAFRIGLDRLLVNLLGFGVPERVLVSHGAVEPPLRGLAA